MLLPYRYRPRLPATAVITAVLAAVACALRVWAGFGDLWLDEVWSIQLADQITSPWEIVTRLRSDNNHMLNTAYVAWLGSDQPLLNYRLPSILAGTLSVIVAGRIAAERGRVEQVTAMVLAATSLLMVHYSSEARGYGLVLLFALAAYWSLIGLLKHGGDRYAIGFAACASLGFLAHSTFLYFYLAACYWSVTVLPAAQRWSEKRWWRAVRSLAMLHGLPSFVAAVLYVVNFRHLELGGGPTYHLAGVLAQAGSLAVGGPALGIGAVLGTVCFTAAVAGGLWVLRRDGDDQWKTLAFCLALPLVIAVATRTPFLFVRYFLVSIAFAHLLCAVSLARLYRQGRWGRFAFAMLLTVFVAANLSHLGRLYRLQRGHYREALQFIADHDSSQTITIGSNHDHGTAILIDFYRRRLPAPRKIVYYPTANWLAAGESPRRGQRPASHPNWLILHHDPLTGPAGYQPTYVVAGQTYRFLRMFDASILSGWQWYCYRNDCQQAVLAGESAGEMLNVAASADR